MPHDPKKHDPARRCVCGRWPEIWCSNWYRGDDLSGFCVGCVWCGKVTNFWRRSSEDAYHDWNQGDAIVMSGRAVVWWYGAFVDDPEHKDEARLLSEIPEGEHCAVNGFEGGLFVYRRHLHMITNDPRWDPTSVWRQIAEDDDQRCGDDIWGFADQQKLVIVSPVTVHKLSIGGPEPEEGQTDGVPESDSAAE